MNESNEMIPRYDIFFCLLLCVTLLTSVRASVLKEALEEHLKDVSHDEDAESIKHDKQKGEKIHHIESQLNDNHKNQYSKANDEGKYLKKEHDTKTQANGYKRGHKKGHQKQGFQNSYHKDESSNKSTYFDDFNDEGDQAAYNSRLNSHDNHGGRSYQGSHNNGQEYVRDNYHGGGYNRYGDIGLKRNDHRDYAKKYYLDDAQNYNKYRNGHNTYNRDNIRDYHEHRAPEAPRDPGWDWKRWEDKRRWERPTWQNNNGWERDYGGPGYYDDYGVRHDGGYGYGPNHGYGYGYDESRANPVAEIPTSAPIVAHRKQTITIYEDPRYDGKEKGQLRREVGDYLQLEFKPSNHRYARYDDTYYNAPTREGAVETSKINRLVYNYRRQ
ncbi:hypothetical protein K1T71_005143 [Dendrolimus kikuchii]|uniref:Uncharacterized protein n=1 Tax=Dendrolimus kikuchii TaxID=765133 RepID=A0ACC1D651_9NEOP|nr:hypothetical protein K1T71_005143 [Dendrolimus kikuchii]